MRRTLTGITVLIFLTGPLVAAEYHVSVEGHDEQDGSKPHPFCTISRAAEAAHPGDTVIVHEGTYREHVNPPRGGTSGSARIIYQAAEGERVLIKGSEVVTNWKEAAGGICRKTLPNTFFGEYNPYQDTIQGDWFDPKGRIHHTGEVYLNGEALFEEVSLERVRESSELAWYCESDETSTTIWVNFQNADPDEERVEINVRRACFYPDEPGRDYITVRGFIMRHAATQWAPPTAEQIGLIGTHWSKGWIIEDNIISGSKCVGLTLGKDRATGDNDLESAQGYNQVIRSALEQGWSKESIGSHVVRNNTIYNCGAAGICGSMGGAFSEITGNHIYNIHKDKPFGGAEMAGIKLHAPIDTLIANNRIHDCVRGIWLDWMTQGARVHANLCYANVIEDLFLEVNHGPYVVDNNVLLSTTALTDWSQGGAFGHNLFAGEIRRSPQSRETPYHVAHSTKIAGLSSIPGGDNRFYNNIFAGGRGLAIYNDAELPINAAGNVYLDGASPHDAETRFVELPGFQANAQVVEAGKSVHLELRVPEEVAGLENPRVTSDLLGQAGIPDLPYVKPDGSPLVMDSDYFGKSRDEANPCAGPFEYPGGGSVRLKVW